jgi:hypothetical protein
MPIETHEDIAVHSDQEYSFENDYETGTQSKPAEIDWSRLNLA